MSKRTIDSAARTARLHPATPHRKPYRRDRVMCDCGGVPQPPTSREASRIKKEGAVLKIAGSHVDIITQRPDNEGDDATWRGQMETLREMAQGYGAIGCAAEKREALRGTMVEALIATFHGADALSNAIEHLNDTAADGGYSSYMEVR